MKPSPFAYHAPATVGEALDLLAQEGDEAKVLAGGQSLVPMLNMRLAAPAHIIDINGVEGLSTISVSDASVEVGATATQAEVAADSGVAAALPLLEEAIGLIAHPAIRNRGTVVGSLAHADPAAELPGVLALLGGWVVAVSSGGRRAIPSDELFAGPLSTTLRPDELAVAACFPIPEPGSATAFVELARRRGDYALCGVGALVEVDGSGRVVAARAAYVGLAGLPQVVDLTEAVAGLPVGREGLDTTGARALAEARVAAQADIHANSSYRRHLAGVLTAQALGAAASRAAPSVTRGSRSRFGSPERPDHDQLLATAPSGPSGGDREVTVELVVNGTPRSVTVAARRLLSDLLRHDLGLTGTHVGCEHGVCGCCTVLLDGRPARSCLTLAATASGHDVTTVEGLAGQDGGLSPEQQAFIDCHGLQCGFCTPGFLMTVTAFLDSCPDPTEEEAREAIAGNLCRCTGYHNIVRSVLRAGELRRLARSGEPAPRP
jgi:xanthine dehydrogenase iron-sulfur cluster and FAD-binding subunit A